VIAAALAAAEGADASADRFLAGVAAGYDVACTVGEAIGPDSHYDRGFHVTATCGTFGAVAAAGVARGLNVPELRNALGIAGSQAAGSCSSSRTARGTSGSTRGSPPVAGSNRRRSRPPASSAPPTR